MILAKAKKACRRLLERVKLHRETFLDAERYYASASWAGPVRRHQLAHIESDLIKHYHVLEKGLSMAEFRPRAGTDVLKRLIELLDIWTREGGPVDSFHFLASQAAVRAYAAKHQSLGIDVSDLIPTSVLDKATIGSPEAGWKSPVSVTEAELASFDKIALSRHSVRNFDPDRIPERSAVDDAVRVATSTPSVCNRQTWRVHLYESDEAQRILAHQNGNRGFGHLIPLVAVVTSDMRLFAGGAERYQAWIEGGLFSMSFMLALHARGLGTVALNWSRSNHDDRRLRVAAVIPGHERIIMLIGIGYAGADHDVACSPRPPVEHFVRWHSPLQT